MIKIITGKNDYELSKQLNLEVLQFIKQYGDLGVEKIDTSESQYEDIYGVITSLPFLVDKKLVILYEPGKNKDFVEKFDDINNLVSDSLDVIIYEPNLDKRSSYYKALKQMPGFMEYNELGQFQLPTWAVNYAKTIGAKLNSSDASFLIQRIGASQLRLKNEIDKLSLFDSNISRQNIENMTESVPRSTIFQLLEYSFAGDMKSVIRLYKQQKQLRVDASQIMALLIWQLHILAIVSTYESSSTSLISKNTKLSTFTVENAQKLLRSISHSKLVEIIGRALELDIKLKTAPIDSDEAVLFFLLSIDS